MASTDHFEHELRTQMTLAERRRAMSAVIDAADLLVAVLHRPSCCRDRHYCHEVMRKEMKAGDEIVQDSDAGGLIIRYALPRN